MAKKKAKWLEESNNGELLNIVKEAITSEEPDLGKAVKAVDELIERNPNATEDLSVKDAIAALRTTLESGINTIETAYNTEAELVAGDVPEDAESDEDEVPEEKTEKKSKKSKKADKAEKSEKAEKAEKKSKKSKKAEPVEDEDSDDEDDSEDDEDSESKDYADMSNKALKKECRNRGIKVNKSMKRGDFIKALEADDKA